MSQGIGVSLNLGYPEFWGKGTELKWRYVWRCTCDGATSVEEMQAREREITQQTHKRSDVTLLLIASSMSCWQWMRMSCTAA